MPPKRRAEHSLVSPLCARRSARLLAQSELSAVNGSVDAANKSKDDPKIKVEYEENLLGTGSQTSEETHATIVKSGFEQNTSTQAGSYDTKEKFMVKSEQTCKQEFIVQAVQLVAKSESSKDIVAPPNGDTFYSQIGSNIFSPVSPKHVNPGQPKNWASVYNEIVKMRGLIFTPVDGFGCERLPDTLNPGMSSTDPKTYRFQLLISLMLSAQTKDEMNFAAMKTLQLHFMNKGYPGICLQAILDSSEAEIDQCIAKVGFHRRKALYIKKSCDLLKEKFDGEIPKTINEIVMLPGVGPKMGHLILQNGWSINSGIGVDVHIHRLAQMWGWVPKSEKPELTRTTLEDWLPKKYWADINPLLVGFGQTVCAPKANNCDICFLASGLCKGVNRKLANTKLTETRIKKLGKSRGDLSRLIKEVIDSR